MSENINQKEMNRLRQMLDKAGIMWQDYSDLRYEVPVFLTRIETKWGRISIASSIYTWGGKRGLLELWEMDKGVDPEGWLTAEAAFKRIKEILEEK